MKLILRKPFSELWRNKDAFAEVEKLSGEVYRSVATRKTIRFEIDGQGFYLKLHHGITYQEYVKNLLSARMPITGAENEWAAIQRLSELGVDTMVGVAYGEKGYNPVKKTSFIITEDLSPTISLEDFCSNWKFTPPPYEQKVALINRVAEMVRKMHQVGVNHRDCYICHFLLHLPFDDLNNFKLSVIDLHRAQIRDVVPRRWRDKDLTALYFSAMDIGLSTKDFLRFLKVYFNNANLKDIFHEEAGLIREIREKAEKILDRTNRKGFRKMEFSYGKFLGRGVDRWCYENRDNPNTCLKVSKKNQSKQTYREVAYFSYLKRKGITPSFMPKFYGLYEYEDSYIMEQEYIRSDEKHDAIDLREFISIATQDQLQQLEKRLGELKEEMLSLNVIVSDMRTSNFMVLLCGANIERIVIFDGYGVPELIPLANIFRCCGKAKIERQWKKFWSYYAIEMSKRKVLNNIS